MSVDSRQRDGWSGLLHGTTLDGTTLDGIARTPVCETMKSLECALPPEVEVRQVGVGRLEAAAFRLSAAERERLAAFGHLDRRRSFALGRLAARELLGRRLGMPPEAVPLQVAPDGAPEVVGHSLAVSITHTGRGDRVRGAAAIGERPLGIDLERVVRRSSGLVQRILNEDEAAMLEAMPGASWEALTLFWSLKEAVLKGLRTGFRRPARSIRLRSVDEGRACAECEGALWSLAYVRIKNDWLTVAWT